MFINLYIPLSKVTHRLLARLRQYRLKNENKRDPKRQCTCPAVPKRERLVARLTPDIYAPPPPKYRTVFWQSCVHTA